MDSASVSRNRNDEPEAVAHGRGDLDRRTVVEREKALYGGVKIGSAFFGWMTATGIAVLLTALVTAAGAALGLADDTDVGAVADEAASSPETIGLVGAILLLVIVSLAFFGGGYVAGRMARFHGVRQGIAVWLWAVAAAVAVAILAAVAGNEYDVLVEINTFPRLPVNEGDLTTAGIVAAALLAVASLVGAILGGLAGMHFHRKVDAAGLGR